MNIEELEDKIIEACEAAKVKGYKILPGTTFVKNQQACLIALAVRQ